MRGFLRRSSPSLLAAVIACSLGVTRARAQQAPMILPAGTHVRSVDFRFTHGRTLDPDDLRQHIATAAPPPEGVFGKVLDFLFGSDNAPLPAFDPLELERDAIRLRMFYDQSGILHTDVGFEVHPDTSARRADVVFVIAEGKPVLLDSVRIAPGDSAGVDSGVTLPDRIEPAIRSAVDRYVHHRFGASEATMASRRARLALRNLGYAFADIWSRTRVDTAANTALFDVRVQLGPKARIARIDITGNHQLSTATIRHELPFKVGDYYTAAKLSRGRRAIQGLDIVRQARVEIPGRQHVDSALTVNVAVQEQPLHIITGETGYSSQDGGTAQVTWSHRNFTGGARTLTTSIGTQSGLFSLDPNAERFVRGVASFKQPYVFLPELSALVSPFVEYRDDFRDRSWAAGSDQTLLYQLGPTLLFSLRYSYSERHVLRYRNGDFSSGQIDFLTLLAQNALLDSLRSTVRRSTVTLSGTFGSLDNVNSPRQGYVLRPTIETTAGTSLNTVEFTRLDLTGAAYYPLNAKVGIAVRFSAGRLYPRGKSLQLGGGDSTLKFLELRDVAFTAGGATDVRGWSSQLLGPKFPDIRFRINGTDTTFVAQQYVPIGGLARVAGTFELRLPFPGLGDAWGTHVFTDGGRVWTPDARFRTSYSLPGDDRFFVAVGAGIDYRTVIGAVRVSLGYKVNPSVDDLRDPQKVLNALLGGTPITDIPTQWIRRFQLHLALGTAF